MTRPRNRAEGQFGIQSEFSITPLWKAGLGVGYALLVLLGFTWVTQWAAEELAYQAALGAPLWVTDGVPFYAPWRWLPWMVDLASFDPNDALAGEIINRVALVSLAPGLAVLGIVNQFRRRHSNRVGDLHGSARFAEREDIQQSSLMNGAGVFVGTWEDQKKKELKYLRHDGPEHVLAFAPTRSGKGVGLVLPTLLTWPGSALIIDIKGENWALTSGWRRKVGQRTLKFDLSRPDSVRFNYLSPIRIATGFEMGDVRSVASSICDPDGTGAAGKNSYFVNGAISLMTGAILHCCYKARLQGQEASFADVLTEFTKPGISFRKTIKSWVDYDHDPAGDMPWTRDGERSPTHPIVAEVAQEHLNRREEESQSVLSTATTALTLFRDPVVAANTRVSDFDIEELMNADDPVSLYLVFRPATLGYLRPLIRLLINQIMTRLTDEMKFEGGRAVKHYKHRLLLLLDEFPALGKLAPVSEAIPFCASYGIKMFLIAQDVKQLRAPEAYGRSESIVANCHVRIAYAPNDEATAEMLSKMTGTTTVRKQNVSVNLSAGKQNRTISEQEVSRRLLTTDEVSQLPGPVKNADDRIVKAGKMLIFVAGRPTIMGTQPLFWEDPTLLKRSQIASPDPTLPAFRRGGEQRDPILVGTQTPSAAPAAASEERQPAVEQDSHAVDASPGLAFLAGGTDDDGDDNEISPDALDDLASAMQLD